jgi:hypothetical protein
MNVHPNPTSLTVTPTQEERDAAKVIARLVTSDDRTRRALYGVSLQALTASALFRKDGTCTINPFTHLVLDTHGRIVGFQHGNLVIDYTPRTGNVPGSGLQPNSMNVTRSSGVVSPEADIYKVLAETDLSPGILTALAEYAQTFTKLPKAIASGIAKAIVSVAITNAVPPEYAGILHLVHRYGATLRIGIIKTLWAADETTAIHINELLIAAPIAGLFPSRLASFTGRKLKDILHELSLPIEARKLQPLALSPISYYATQTDRSINSADLGWLTPSLLNALPSEANLQHRITSLAMELGLRRMEDADIAEACTWAASHVSELYKDLELSKGIADWLTADPSILKRVHIKPWHGKIGADTALDSVKLLSTVHDVLKAPARANPFPLPPWAHHRQLPNARWNIHPCADEIDLIASGQLLGNCAATYTARCRDGRTVLAEIRRPKPPTPLGKGKTKLPVNGNGEEVAALVEIAFAFGRWRLAQAKGPHNTEALQSVTTAVQRLVDELNATTTTASN